MYSGYLSRQLEDIEAFKKEEHMIIPEDLDYDGLPSLSTEVKSKLKSVRPATIIGSASRIQGVTPAAVITLMGAYQKNRNVIKTRSRNVPEHPFDFLNRVMSKFLRKFSRGFLSYYELLIKWQKKINLVSSGIHIENAWERHFLDSLQLLKHIDKHSQKIADIGTGAGFPGMALAISGAADMHLVESDAKKIAFLKRGGAYNENQSRYTPQPH